MLVLLDIGHTEEPLIVGAFVSSRSIKLLEQHIDFSLLGSPFTMRSLDHA